MVDQLMTVKDAAARLGVTPAAVYALCREGKLAHYRLGLKGGVVKILPADLEAYVQACRVDAGSRRGKPETLQFVRQPA